MEKFEENLMTKVFIFINLDPVLKIQMFLSAIKVVQVNSPPVFLKVFEVFFG